MARRSRPAGVQTKPKEDEDLRPGRKLFALHKNMHSFGFMVGTDTVAKQYFDKVSQDLQHRFQSVEPPRLHEPTEFQQQKMLSLRQEIQRKDAELRQVKKSYQALIRVNREVQQSERGPMREEWSEGEKGNSALLSPSPPRLSPSPPLQSPSPPLLSPSPGYSSALGVHDIAGHPAFKVVRYTRKRPKDWPDNPILGYSAISRPSPHGDVSQHRRDNSFAEYGSRLLK